VEVAVAPILAHLTQAILADRGAVQQIHPVVLDHIMLGAQAQQDKEIQVAHQIQEQVADSMVAVEVVLVLQAERVRSKVKVVTVMHG
jgi:hypothetical protein